MIKELNDLGRPLRVPLERRSDARSTIQPIAADVERGDPGRPIDRNENGENAGEKRFARDEQRSRKGEPSGNDKLGTS